MQAFVAQNRKVAQAQLKGLKDEAEKLRSRLQRVEAGIKRWEALLTALEKSGAIAVAESPKPPRFLAPRPEPEIKRGARFSVKRLPVGPSTDRETPPPLDSVPSEKQPDSTPPAPAEDPSTPAPPPVPR